MALGRSRTQQGATTLLEGLADQDWQVREAAAVSAGKVKPKGALQPLIELMEDATWQVRVKATTTLGRLGDPAAVPLGETFPAR